MFDDVAITIHQPLPTTAPARLRMTRMRCNVRLSPLTSPTADSARATSSYVSTSWLSTSQEGH